MALLLFLVSSTARAGENGVAYREYLEAYHLARHCGLDDYVVTSGFRIALIALHETGAVTMASARRYRAEHSEQAVLRNTAAANGATWAPCESEGQDAALRLRRLVTSH